MLSRSRTGRMLEDVFRDADHFFSGLVPWERQINIDVHEKDNEVIITADVPGIAKDDLSVTIENDILTIAGERQRETDEDCCSERHFGSFSRSLRLNDVEASSINATLKNGVLQLTLNRSESAKPRKIEIS